MAENIALRQERKLAFYEELLNSGIYGKKDKKKEAQHELKRLLKQDEAFEIKINSPLKTIDDYCEYINFKKNLFSKITARGRHSNALKLQHVKYSITLQIKNLYTEGLNLFPHEISFWQAYLKFCRTTKFHIDGTVAYEKLLSFHGDDTKFWLDAVQWECDVTQNIEKAKNLLLSAIDKHPNCLNLHMKLFKILLSLAKSEQSADYRLAIAVFENTKNCNFPIDDWAKILDIAEEYTFANKFQEHILGYMINEFPNRELLWHILAQRELKGYYTGHIMHLMQIDDKMEIDKNKVSSMDSYNRCEKLTFARRLELCSELYESALKVINSKEMWTYYINAMLEVNKDTRIEKALKWKFLERAFQGAIHAQKLSESHFRGYIDILRETNANDHQILEVIEQGPLLFPNSALPWEIYLCHFIIQDKEEKVTEIFRKACQVLQDPDQTFPLWRIMLQYYQALPNKYDIVQLLYWKVCNYTSEKFLPFRVLYLEYCSIHKPQKVEDLYEKLAQLSPPYLPLHRKMASILSVTIDPKISQWRKCHQNAVKFFGEQLPDVWIEYMNFERDHGDPSKISEIYREASATLKEKKFIIEYNVFNVMGEIDLTREE